MRSLTPSSSSVASSQFPITNGSLYSDLSLSRRVAESQRARRRVERESSLRAITASEQPTADSFNLSLSSLQSELDSMDNPLDASQHSLSFSSTSSSALLSPPHLNRSPCGQLRRYLTDVS